MKEIEAAHKAADDNWVLREVRGAQIENEDLVTAIVEELDALVITTNSTGRQTYYCCGKPGRVKRTARWFFQRIRRGSKVRYPRLNVETAAR